MKQLRNILKRLELIQTELLSMKKAETTIAAHEGLKVTSPCPDWVTNK